MRLIFELLSSSAATAFGWMLVHSLWQISLLSIIAFAAFYFLRNRSATQRYNAGIMVLGLQIVVSAATFYYYLNAVSKSVVHHYSAAVTKTITEAVYWQPIDRPIPLTARVQFWLNGHIHELVICWLIGAALLMLRFAGGWIYTERLKYTSRIVMDQQWRARFGVLTAKLNITKSIEFRESARITSPIVIGVLQPAVLIPLGLLTGFSVSQIEAILTHELAHIRRNDYLVNLLQSLAEVIFFFHPAIWWLSEKIRTERENCCDDIALSVCGDKMSLVNALVKVAEWQSAPKLAMAFVSKKPLLLNRIRRVLGVTSAPSRPFANAPAIFLAICLIAGISFYSVAQQEKKQVKKNEKAKKITQRDDFKKLQQTVVTEVQQTVTDTVVKRKQTKDSLEFKTEDNKVESLAQAYHNISKYFSVDEIRSTLASLNHNDIEMLSAQLPMLGNDGEKLSDELEKLRRRMEELNLLAEKENFEMERFQRKIEKLDWKKDRLMESRGKLIEKRASVFNSPRTGQQTSKNSVQNLSESELEKQLEEFEQQIKVQEQQISEFNLQIASARKEAEVYQESEVVKSIRMEIDDINRKMATIHKHQEFANANFTSVEGDVTFDVAKPARITVRSKATIKGKGAAIVPAAPKAPPAVPAPKKLSPPKAPPVPPVKNK